jgi:hypothetical protein
LPHIFLEAKPSLSSGCFSRLSAVRLDLVALARNADVFVCEAIDAALPKQMENAAKEAIHIATGGNSNSTQESVEAGLIASVHKLFPGQVIVGRDQMKI